MKMTLHVLLWWFLTIVLMVGAAYLWVWIYATFITTGGDQAFYEAYAQKASPVVAVVTAFPVFFLMGRQMQRFADKALFASMAVVLMNALLEVITTLTMATDVGYLLPFSIGAFLLKVAGAYLGAGGRPRQQHA